MALLSRRPKTALLTLILVATAAFLSSGMWWTTGDPILTVHDASLTSYLPTSATNVQDIEPMVGHRGVNLEGTLRAGAALPMAMEGNPFENIWSGGPAAKGPINLGMGTYRVFDVDLSLPAPGFRWNVGRSYNARQKEGENYVNSDGYQGKNWFQMSQPEILLYEGATDDDDVVYLYYGADRFIEFARVDIAEGTSDTFIATNGAAGVMVFAEGVDSEPDTYTYTDQHSNTIVFFGFANASPADGQIWKMTDPDGNTAYVGDDTTGSTAISGGFESNGGIEYAFDSADRRYTYTYTELDSVLRLTRVKAETKTGGTWAGTPTGVTEVGRVDYEYYSDEVHGDAGDLKLVEVTTPLTDSGVSLTKKKYYRYWEGTYNASTNPGYPHALKMVLDFEGTRNQDYAGDQTFDEDFALSTTQDDDIDEYAAAYLEYDTSHRVDLAWFSGECGCSGAGDGTHEYEYESNGNYSDDPGFDTEWATRTVVKRPDGSYETQCFDEAYQPHMLVITDADPDNTSPVPSRWVTDILRANTGQVRGFYTPACITDYTHSTGATTKSSTAGIHWLFTRDTSGATKQFVNKKQFRVGTSGNWFYDGTWSYSTAAVTPAIGLEDADADVIRPFLASVQQYPTNEDTQGTVYNEWSYTTLVHTDTLAISTVTTTEPSVSSGNNGSGSSVLTRVHYNEDGTLAFEKSGSGIITYHEYTNGRRTKLIRDADTTKTGSGEDFENVTIPDNFSSTGSPIHDALAWTYDDQGRRDTYTRADDLVEKWYYTNLADERLVTVHYPRFDDDTTDTFYGPADSVVTNHAGKAEASATVAISGGTSTTALTGHVDETEDDPITAMDLGSLASLSTNHYSDNGTALEESRLYFDVPASSPGTDGTNYDPTLYGYDDSGRRTRVKHATGTIARTVFDLHGRVTERHIGTNDSSFDGGEASGTDNMVKTEGLTYDAGNDDGNGLMTQRTLFVEDNNTDDRVTNITYDAKGNILLVQNPVSPHAFHKVDNVGRTIATGLYSSTTSITALSDDPTSKTANRIGLSQTFYDERGMVWKSQRHKIDPDDGTNDGDVNLPSLTWYDADGRTIKADGAQLQKTIYDRLGRVTHEIVLASDNDTSYSDADDVTGDIVLQEWQNCYKASSGRLLMTATIDRFHDDAGGGQTTGPLDENSDGFPYQFYANDLKGRIQITSFYYDDLGRVDDTVDVGTHGGVTYNRLAGGVSPPTRASDNLRETITFDDAGNLAQIEDPGGTDTYYEYDDAGRVTKEVKNYDASVNSGNPSGTDDNVTVKYEYTDGLMTKLTADLPSGEDQHTIYTYGTTKGTSAGDSKVATGHFLWKIQYPDSVGGTDVVTLACNAQSEQIWKKDQAGNIFETEYDDNGRQTELKWTTTVSGFDTAVRRIQRTYDSLGRPELVTQHDANTGGNVVDEAGYSYDDWGPVSSFQYDRDSAIDAQGSDDEYTLSHVYEKNTDGRNAIRKTQTTFPSGNVISYTYESTDSHDDDVSRATEVKDGATVLCAYDYLGIGTVVGTTYDEPDVFRRLYDSDGDIDSLDELNRVISDVWTKDLAQDKKFVHCEITWDQGGNITLIEDNVHSGFDVSVTKDDLDRLTRAEEGSWDDQTSAITNRTRDQQWTLDHVGNWNQVQLDLDGDGYFTGQDEYDDDRSHPQDYQNSLGANELKYRDVNDDGNDDYTLTYDAVGNLADDGENYEYEYDGFGRLRKIKDTSDQSLIVEMKYNGLSQMTAYHEDTDDDDDVDANDKWFYRMYDERWRWVATFREDDTDPKEEFISHQAGLDGKGASSYIDLVILRDRDGGNEVWTTAADGMLEERIYYCQNWRADVSAIVEDTGEMIEWVKYSAYGVPFGLPRGDTDSDGETDAADRASINGWSSGYDVRYDVDLDGDIDANDESAANNLTLGLSSASAVRNVREYAGYTNIGSSETLCLARHRVLHCSLGRWLTRDPLEFLDGPNLYEYVQAHPVLLADPYGTTAESTDSEPNCPGFCNYTCGEAHMIRSSDFRGGAPATCKYKCSFTFGICPIGCDCPRDPVAGSAPSSATWADLCKFLIQRLLKDKGHNSPLKPSLGMLKGRSYIIQQAIEEIAATGLVNDYGLAHAFFDDLMNNPADMEIWTDDPDQEAEWRALFAEFVRKHCPRGFTKTTLCSGSPRDGVVVLMPILPGGPSNDPLPDPERKLIFWDDLSDNKKDGK